MMRAIKMSGVLGLMLAVNATLPAEETKGTIKSVNTGRNEVVIKGTVSDSIYELKKDADVWLDGTRSKLADLRADDRAVIHYEKTDEHMIANQVRALRRAQEAIGTVKDVYSDKKEITLKGIVKNTTYELSKDAIVWVEGKRGALTDIRESDQVTVTYEQRGDHMMANNITLLKRK